MAVVSVANAHKRNRLGEALGVDVEALAVHAQLGHTESIVHTRFAVRCPKESLYLYTLHMHMEMLAQEESTMVWSVYVGESSCGGREAEHATYVPTTRG